MKWKKIDKTHHEISDTGVIRNCKTKKVLKTKIDRYGYPCIGLAGPGKKMYYTVHRLMALAWIPNYKKLPQVNHIDGNKKNFSISNLEWCTSSRNITHSLETGLNRNCNKVIVRDHRENKEFRFRSIKQSAAFLKMHASTLVPLIKNSYRNKILDRFSVELVDETSLEETSNTKNFGTPVWVYDFISDELSYHKSILATSYHTGLRFLSSLDSEFSIYKIGYLISSVELTGKENEPLSEQQKQEAWLQREEYVLTPYKQRVERYQVFNYDTMEERTFECLDDTVDFIKQFCEKHVEITKNKILYSVYDSKKRNNTGLIGGFGVRDDDRIPWTNYTLEAVLSNRMGFAARVTVVELIVDGISKIVYTFKGLCDEIGLDHSKVNNSRWKHVNKKLIDSPNIKVNRLDKPIFS